MVLFVCGKLIALAACFGIMAIAFVKDVLIQGGVPYRTAEKIGVEQLSMYAVHFLLFEEL
ncbi:hypothetical protein QUF88_26245 [Bacillus sp. DX1.1]|uniref:hypothetical protein n=1 Tax=unclassified Bacillus (in: firmicutes) TaxID=185979 RepID=UPI00256FBFB6|nr:MULTISPECIES: hypothetical protein [unclassified Bacillus (in: firmicutes)]MDM5157190.1 hypothetical protein [Bacillus sp. DX1.1]WJE81421.1 hypothetical protein QRE67_23785 [Bacillus sp. DX3.1]